MSFGKFPKIQPFWRIHPKRKLWKQCPPYGRSLYVANRKLSLGGGEDLSTWEPASDDHWSRRCNLNLWRRRQRRRWRRRWVSWWRCNLILAGWQGALENICSWLAALQNVASCPSSNLLYPAGRDCKGTCTTLHLFSIRCWGWENDIIRMCIMHRAHCAWYMTETAC